MQKWSPEPFDTPVVNPKPVDVEATEFESASAVLGSKSGSVTACHFRSESGFTDPKSLMNSLTTEERSQVYELVQMDVADEYEEREQELRADFDQRLTDLQKVGNERFDAWTAQIATVLAAEVREAATSAAQVAVQMAGKIVRRAVVADPEILARAIEATIYKIAANEPLTIQASADDAEWLNRQPELLERLHIGEIIADRRVEPGGCLIQCQGREWDATLARQLGSLEAIVDEMLATAETPVPLNVPSENVPVAAMPQTNPNEPTTESETSDDPGLA